MARSLAFAALFVVASLVGCSPPAATSTEDVPELELSIPAESAAVAQTHGAPQRQQELTPDKIVESFLAAVRAGDEGATSQLLTDKAREETAKHNLVVRPPGTPSAKFAVGEMQYIDANQTGAHVNTVWTETLSSEDGGQKTVTYDVVWALRKQEQGWRVAGIATEIIEGQPPVFLNFEDPSDMLSKWKRAEEIAARHEQSVHEQTVRQARTAESDNYRR